MTAQWMGYAVDRNRELRFRVCVVLGDGKCQETTEALDSINRAGEGRRCTGHSATEHYPAAVMYKL